MNKVIWSRGGEFDWGWIGVLGVVSSTELTEEVGRTVGKDFTISKGGGGVGPDLWR